MSDIKHKPSRSPFEEAWRKRFISFSSKDDDAGIAGWSATGLEARFRHFTKVWAGNGEGALWLDAGCGAGTYTRFLAEHGAQVTGMDYSHPTVVKARERATDRVTWVAADVTKLPVAANVLDGVLCFGVVQALEKSEPAIDELTRVVKPGGQVWVDALNGWCIPSIWDRIKRWASQRPMHLRYESPRRLRRMMFARDCTSLRIYWVVILPPSLQGYQRYLESPAVRLFMRYFPFANRLLSHAFVVRGEKVGRSNRPSRATASDMGSGGGRVSQGSQSRGEGSMSVEVTLRHAADS